MSQQTPIPPEAIRRKRLRLLCDTPETPDLSSIAGLIGAERETGSRRFTAVYDVRETALDALVRELQQRGVTLDIRPGTRLAIAWRSYLDRNARAHLTHPGSPCCSNPTSVYAARKKR